MRLTIKQVEKIIRALYNLHCQGYSIPALFNGPTGLGKTSLVESLGRELGIEVVNLKLGFIPDVIGAGIPETEEGAFKLLPHESIKLACEKPTLLFLDEISLAGDFKLASSLIFEKKVLGYALHPSTYVVSACNYGVAYDTNRLSDAVLGRFAVFNVGYSAENVDYLVQKYKNPRLAQLKARFVAVATERDQNEDLVPGANPRLWEYVCWVEQAAQQKIITEDEYKLILIGLLPPELYKEYLSVPAEAVEFEKLVNGEPVEITPALLTYIENIFETLDSDVKLKAIMSLSGVDSDIVIGSLQKLINKLSASEKVKLLKTEQFEKVKNKIKKFIG